MKLAIQYGGRVGGAYLAYRYLGHKIGGGALGTAAIIALGWLAGGFAADLAADRVAK